MFHRSSSHSSGLRPECKECKSKADRLYREANIDKKKLHDQQYYQANQERKKQISKDWYNLNRDRAAQYKRVYFQQNKEKIYEYRKEYNDQNYERLKDYMNKYMKEKYHNNINYRIKSICNKRIRDGVRQKSKSTMDYIGCDIEHLKQWFEYQFVEGMTWDNMGRIWHIDHVRPCSSFNFDNEDDIYQCYHWSNLQPLFAQANMEKGATVDEFLILKVQLLAEQFTKSMTYQVS